MPVVVAARDINVGATLSAEDVKITEWPGNALPTGFATSPDEVVASLDLDANPPIGAILHVVGQSDDGIQVTEIWRTEQAFQAFNDRFVSALQMQGYLSRPTIETAQLHNLFAVEMDTIERMGAVSLPGSYAGAAL